MKQCDKCGNELDLNDSFCSQCGAKIVDKAYNNINVKIDLTNSTTEKILEKINSIFSNIKYFLKRESKIIIGIGISLLILVGLVKKQREMAEKEKCIIYKYKYIDNINIFDSNDEKWDYVRKMCDLSYTELDEYKAKLGTPPY